MKYTNTDRWEVHETKNGCIIGGFNDQSHDEDTPMVFVTGIGGDVSTMKELAKEYREYDSKVIVVDVGHGGSKFMRPSTMHAYSEILNKAITEEFDGEPVIMTGWSWGGPLVQKEAVDHPEIVEQIGLLATVNRGIPVRFPSFSTTLEMMQPNRSERRLNRTAGDLYGGPVRKDVGLIANLGVARKVVVEAYVRQNCALTLDMAMNTTGWFRDPSPDQPAVIIAGDDDPLADHRNSEELHRRMPNSILHIIKGEGHLFPMTMAKETARMLAEGFHQA